MSLTKRSRASLPDLLREQRYRRQLLPEDGRQVIAVIATVDIALFAYVRNDLLLLRGTPALLILLAVKVANALVGAAAIVALRRERRPAAHDRAVAAALSAMTVTLACCGATRLPSGEYQGGLIGTGVLLCIFYFALRGPLWHRGIAAVVCSMVAIALAWNPRAIISPVGRNSAVFGMVALNIIGALSARSFEEQRRKRHEAERQERRARRDLAEKVREIAAEKERAVALARARTSFLAAMSHEFRTPMNAVIGLSELLVAAPLSPEDRDHARTIRDSARALLSMLNDILDFTKIDADRIVLMPAPFDARALFASVVDMLRPGAEAKGLTLDLSVSPEVPEGLSGDEARLRQVLVNLVSNAIKFTERGAVSLSVSARALGAGEHEARFRVEDSGIGIAPAVLPRLFQPFEQADTGITRRYGGTGLGLSISKQIIAAMGGDIEVESEPGRGSAFSFSIRLAEAAPPRASSTSMAGARPGAGRLSILVVDDHPINRRVALALLGQLEQAADVVGDGAEAIAAVARRDYDVIFMDLNMPGMSGVEATRLIEERLGRRRRPRVVAMTASVFEEDRAACLAAGMSDFLAKPIDVRQLEALLGRVAEEVGAAPPGAMPAATLAEEPLEQLRQLERLGEPGLVASLCRDFIADTRERLSRMERALEGGALGDLEREAHSLKAASASLGAGDLSALAAGIEAAARGGALVEGPRQIHALAVEVERVERALRRAMEA